MGSKSSKRVLNREEKRWLESQDPSRIAFLITEARKSQSLNGLAGQELTTSMMGGHYHQLNNQHQNTHSAKPNHYVSTTTMTAPNGGLHQSYRASELKLTPFNQPNAINWQLQSLDNKSTAGFGFRTNKEDRVGGHMCCDICCQADLNWQPNQYKQHQHQQQQNHNLHQQHYPAETAQGKRHMQDELRVYYNNPDIEEMNVDNDEIYSQLPQHQAPFFEYHQNKRNFNINSSTHNHHNNNKHSQQYVNNSDDSRHISSNYWRGQEQRKNTKTIAVNNNSEISSLTSADRKLQINYPIMMESEYQKGLNFTKQERVQLGLVGLLPPAHQDKDTQIKWVLNYLEQCCGKDPLAKYIFLRNLKDFNEPLFYSTLMANVETLMPIVYTPIVGLACQKFSHLFMKPRGLFISLQDAGKIPELLSNWKEKDVRVIVVTDGERILGLGDLGANGMGISIGKLSLYTALAGVPPINVLPVTLDVGTNNESNLADPFYIGLRQNRTRGKEYESLVDEFMRSVVDRWGRSCLIQFEDFGNQNAFALLERYRASYCTFNDDIQGTASVCLSGLLSATKSIDKRLKDMRFLFYGSGEANLGTANLIEMAMIEHGVDAREAKTHIWLVDSKGLVVNSRGDLTEHKRTYAQDGPKLEKLLDIIKHVKPNAIIGASAQGGAFDESVCKLMAHLNDRPIIFALSNPTTKAECTAQQAYEWTDGRCVFASGSPFPPVDYNGRRYVVGQGNNAYIFPAVGLAAIAAHMHTIPEECFLVAASALSDLLKPAEISVGLVYPSLSRIRECTLKIAARLLEYFYCERLATYRPEPVDKVNFLKSIQYDGSYPKIAPIGSATRNMSRSTTITNAS